MATTMPYNRISACDSGWQVFPTTGEHPLAGETTPADNRPRAYVLQELPQRRGLASTSKDMPVMRTEIRPFRNAYDWGSVWNALCGDATPGALGETAHLLRKLAGASAPVFCQFSVPSGHCAQRWGAGCCRHSRAGALIVRSSTVDRRRRNVGPRTHLTGRAVPAIPQTAHVPLDGFPPETWPATRHQRPTSRALF